MRMQRPEAEPGQHLVLYDGACGFCSETVQIILRRDSRGVFHFAALQSPLAAGILGRFGIDPRSLGTFYLILNYRGAAPRLLAKGRAALLVIAMLGWPVKSVGLLWRLPDWVLDAAYDLTARNRYRIPGRRKQCVLPLPELRNRFVDAIPPMGETPR
jgi:predicted DCC family thiol-disulfide oxidoreductase YuxK